MTDDEWRHCDWPERMIDALGARAGDRKLRLFAAACCRLVWDHLPLDACRDAVALGEQAADNLVAGHDLAGAYRELNGRIASERGSRARLAQATVLLLRPHFRPAHARCAVQWARTGRDAHLLHGRQAHLLRDVFGDVPRRIALGVRPSPRAVERARTIYRDGQFDALPDLADELAAHGPAAPQVLAHCRGPGPHVRGCWAVDVVLGTE
jgi:hypothetical protein